MIIINQNSYLNEILKKLRSFCKSKCIILHSDLFKLGFYRRDFTYHQNLNLIHDSIMNIFHDFQIIVPTFNYDFVDSKIFDIKNDKAQVGALNEYFRKNYILNRTHTPIFNIITTKKSKIIKKTPCKDPHGKMSFYNIAYINGYDIILLGKFIPSMAHFVERKIKVPYRYIKKISGTIKKHDGKMIPITLLYNVRPNLKKHILIDNRRIKYDLEKNKLLKCIKNNNNFLGCYNAKEVSEFWIKENLSNYMYFLTKKSKLNAKHFLTKFGNPLKVQKIEQ